MTRNDLRQRLLLVMTALLVMIGALAYTKFAAWTQYYDLLKDVIPLLVALLAAYFAQVLQQRAIFVASLRSLWAPLIEAKTMLLRYASDPDPTWDKYQDAYDSLSRAIDDVRSVYRNYGESKEYKGLYPYEPMHDMRKALRELGFENVDLERQRVARNRIQQAWDVLRPRFLAELGAPIPIDAITDYNAQDTRKPGIDPKARESRNRRRT